MQLDLQNINLFRRKLVLDKNVFFITLALLTYAFFSSSTPDSLGVAEALIAFSLLALSGSWGYFVISGKALQHKNILEANLYIVYLIFLYLLYVPLVVGLIRGNNLVDIIRDIIPFLYLFIIIFFDPFMKKNKKKYLKIFVLLLCIIGISFSIRHIGSIDNLSTLGKSIIFGDMNYFVMDPAVLFASTFLLNYGYIGLFLEKGLRKKAISLILFIAGFVAFLSILGVIVRGQIGLVLFSLFLSTIFIFIKRPFVISIFIVPIILVFIVVFGEQIANIWSLIVEKTSHTGVLNNRDKEFSAVMQMLSLSLDNLLFGQGWGGLITSPVAGTVRFTHFSVTYFLLKTGLVGAILFVLFILILFKYLQIIFLNNIFYFSLALAGFNSLIINVFLEAGYKTMSFGLLVLILILSGEIINESKKTRS